VERYLKNNFLDVSKQDAYDLVLGNFEPLQNLSRTQLFVDHRPLFIQAVPYILAASLIMFLAGMVLPRAPGSDSTSHLADIDATLPLQAFLAFWAALFFWSVYFITTNGGLYVHWPRLVPLDFAPHISGQADRVAALEKGEGTRHKRDVSVSAPRGPAGVLGMLFGRWAPGHYAGGEEVEMVGVGRAHAE
jgi:phosphatidylinositol 4-phosphatase